MALERCTAGVIVSTVSPETVAIDYLISVSSCPVITVLLVSSAHLIPPHRSTSTAVSNLLNNVLQLDMYVCVLPGVDHGP